MAVNTEPQVSIYETTLDNPAIETALEDREKAKARRRDASSTFRKKDEAVKGLVDSLDLGQGAPVRVGRFVLSLKPVAGRSVSFETDPTERLQISLLDEA